MSSEPTPLTGVLETVLYARNLADMEAFYTGVLRLEVARLEPERHLFLRCGSSMVLIFDPRFSAEPLSFVGDRQIPSHGADGPGHMAFRVAPEQLDSWRQRLLDAEVAIEQEISWPEGGHSIYFRDPAGNSLEFATPALWRLP